MKQMLVHCHDDTVQMALIEDGKLVEYAAERSRQQSIVGSFYLGKVVNVLPGMQAAFVDIGLKKCVPVCGRCAASTSGEAAEAQTIHLGASSCRPGSNGAGHEGCEGRQGPADYDALFAPGAMHRIYANRRLCGCLQKNSERGGTRSSEDDRGASENGGRGVHYADGCRG